MKNKIYTTQYRIETPYFKSDYPSKILVGSDIHYHPGVSKDLFRQIVRYAQETQPDFIVMPGDQVETIDFIDDTKEREFFESIIRGLSEVAPLIIIPGNHEIHDFSPKNFKDRLSSSGVNTKAMKYFEGLNRIKGVYFLADAQTTIKGVTFLGFNPRLSTYQKKDDEKTEDEFIEDYIKSGLKMAEEDYNILLTHSPIQITNERVLSSVPDFSKLTDLVISGHLHDGYLPKFLDKPLGKTNAGLFFTPLVAPYPGIICRGVHDFGRGYIFISQGYRKWTANMAIMNAFEKITANDLEELIIRNGEEKEYTEEHRKL